MHWLFAMTSEKSRRRRVYIAVAAVTLGAFAAFLAVLALSLSTAPRADDVLPPGAPGRTTDGLPARP